MKLYAKPQGCNLMKWEADSDDISGAIKSVRRDMGGYKGPVLALVHSTESGSFLQLNKEDFDKEVV